MNSISRSLITVTIVILCSCASAHADSVTIDPVGDFLATYTGPTNGDLDVVNTNVSLLGTNLVFNATLNANVGTTAQAFYIWGVNRGAGTANFAVLGLPNIIFDSVIRINPDGTGTVTLIGGATTNLAPGSISITANTFQAVVPLALLPSNGFNVSQYGQNLWPRFGGSVGNAQISDFAPNASLAQVAVPEPTTLLLLGTGLVGVFGYRRKR